MVCATKQLYMYVAIYNIHMYIYSIHMRIYVHVHKDTVTLKALHASYMATGACIYKHLTLGCDAII